MVAYNNCFERELYGAKRFQLEKSKKGRLYSQKLQ